MTSDDRELATRVAKGAAIGLVAGLVASFAMNGFQALTQPPSDGDEEPATQKAADRVAAAVTGSPVPADEKPLAGQLVHYGLGAALGAGYGIAASLDPRATAGFGSAFVVATWSMLDEAAVPAAGLGDTPWQAPPGTQAYGLASHLVFGIATEATRRLATRLLSRA